MKGYESLIKESDPHSLGSGSPPESIDGSDVEIKVHTVAITLNLPRTKFYMTKTSEEQKKHLRKGFDLFLSKHPMFCKNVTKDIQFEFCQDGNIHLHAIVQYFTEVIGCIAGLIADCVKTLIKVFKIKDCYDGKRYKPEWERYRCPFSCIQYLTTNKQIHDWVAYLNKEDYNVSKISLVKYLLI